MSLQTRLQDVFTSIATDIKQMRIWVTGSSSGSLSGLTTSDKTSVVAAINEVKNSSSGAPPDATESVKGVVELATLTEVTAGVDTTRAVTSAGVAQEVNKLKTDILGGASGAYDTLKELEDAVGEASTDLTDLLTIVGEKADTSDIYTQAQLGDPETDLVAVYTAAKA